MVGRVRVVRLAISGNMADGHGEKSITGPALSQVLTDIIRLWGFWGNLFKTAI